MKNIKNFKRVVLIIIILALFPNCIFANETNKIGTVNRDDINVRLDSRVTADVLGILKKGETVSIVGSNYNWYNIIVPKRFSCFAASEFLNKIAADKYEVAVPILNLREKPSLDSQILGKVEEKTVLTAVKTVNKNWLEVVANPYVSAWVHQKFLDVSERKAVEEKEPVEKKSEKVSISGKLYDLEKNDSCSANYKLKSARTVVNLKIGDSFNPQKMRRKRVAVMGQRKDDAGCSYIEVEDIEVKRWWQ